MKRRIIKSFVLAFLTLTVGSAFAQQVAFTPASCAAISNEAIAKDILTLIETGADEGLGKCSTALTQKSVKVSNHSRDFYSRRVVLNAGDQVLITSPIVEGRDAYGPTNEFTVKYVIRKANGQVLPGAFSFSRLYESSYIRELGCAMIQVDPTVSFIKPECL